VCYLRAYGTLPGGVDARADKSELRSRSLYHYSFDNPLRHIFDSVPAEEFADDVDDQKKDNYTYDQQGNMTYNLQREISITYDYRSLPNSITVGPPTAPNGTTTYRYDANGRRTYKSTEYGATYYYINDVQGRTIAVLKANGSLKMLNLLGLDHIGYIDAYYIPQAARDEDAPRSDARFYYLKDHLGNIKVTVDQGGNVASYEDFDPYGMGPRGGVEIERIDTRFELSTKERDDTQDGEDRNSADYDVGRVAKLAGTATSVSRFSFDSHLIFLYTLKAENPSTITFFSRGTLISQNLDECIKFFLTG